MPKPASLKAAPARPKSFVSQPWLIAAALAVLTLLLYWPITSHGFINYDDPDYVTENPHIQDGLTAQGIAWAFQAGYAGNWHPLTWISHMVDIQIFGLKSGGHHFTSLFLHTSNAVLLFLVLRALTGTLWRSAIVAALFALHPLRVESVAWVAERKDVLSGFFFLLTVWSYVLYTRMRSSQSNPIRWYVLSLILFAFGLMAKPMLVTLPCVLLLLDYWPLKRLPVPPITAGQPNLLSLIIEKLPFLLLSIGSSVATFLAQSSSGSVFPWEQLPFSGRLANAIVAYFAYLKKMVWPAKLAVFYPHPLHWPFTEIVLSAVALLLITVFVFWVGRRTSAVPVGWLWYLGMLVPVIGLVQVGSQAMADRYTYLPFIGLNIALVWGLHQFFTAQKWAKAVPVGLTIVILVSCAGATRVQLRYWQNSLELFQDALRNLPESYFSYVPYTNVGFELSQQGRYDEAVPFLREAVRLNPQCGKAWNNLGTIAERKGNLAEARNCYDQAVKFCPEDAQPWNNLASALTQLGEVDAGLRAGETAIKIRPKLPQAHYNVGNLLAMKADIAGAIAQYRTALLLKTNYPEAHYNLGVCLAKTGFPQEARLHFQETLRYNPQFRQARQQLEALQPALPAN